MDYSQFSMSALRGILCDMQSNRCYVPAEELPDYDKKVKDLEDYINAHRYD